MASGARSNVGRVERLWAAARCGGDRSIFRTLPPKRMLLASAHLLQMCSNGALAALDGVRASQGIPVSPGVRSGSNSHVRHTLREVRGGAGGLCRVDLKGDVIDMGDMRALHCFSGLEAAWLECASIDAA